MSHFTYQPSNLCNLSQGDILDKTTAIKKIIEEVHPHYLKSDYKYLLVLTQSCDLIRRGPTNKCKARYITIAAVRPLESLLNKQLTNYMDRDFLDKLNICNRENKNKMKQFLERLFNNNESEYFYLNEDLNYDFYGNHVAFLKLSIAIKSELHYENCLKTKKFELKDTFKTKLGWLVGQMYSRVGTEDWVPDNINRTDFSKKIDDVINCTAKWCEKDIISYIENNPSLIQEFVKSPENINSFIEKFRSNRKTKKEELLNTLSGILKNKTELHEEQIIKLLNIIRNNPVISHLTK